MIYNYAYIIIYKEREREDAMQQSGILEEN